MRSDPQKLKRGSPDRFGYEWSSYRDIFPESKVQLERWLGETTLESFAGKAVLDVGCGMGRNPYWLLQAGAASVTAVDVDDQSLAAAQANLKAFPNAVVRRLSAYDVSPQTVGRFDRVTCIGVLHHLEAPEQALRALWSCVAPGGELILWCYAREGNERILPFIQAARAVGSRLPVAVTHAVAKALTVTLWPALVLLPWKTDYYRKLKSLSFRNIESIVFDQMLPRISHYWTRAEIEALAAPLGGRVLVEFVQGNSWHVKVTRAS
jgi:2-polyprenyl-3-methyl-5-hydroxy-6-metoxy-1,4-benzoquinol methylase